MLTSTASATRFSISRSIERLYLLFTYSGLAAYRHAIRPPSGVMPTRSPIPRTAATDKCQMKARAMVWNSAQVSMCVAPASRAVYAFAMARGTTIRENPMYRPSLLTHSSIVMQVNLNVTINDTPQRSDEVVHLSWVRASDGISNSDSVHTNLVHCLVN